MSPKRLALVGLIVGIVGLVAAAGMAVALVSDDEGAETDGATATEDGFFVEPVGSLGPDAFTPSFAVGGSTVCDKAKFLQELQDRPDAIREWAEVMGITPEQVPAYVESLQAVVLDSDTKVTNHGLHDGQAYARQSLLVAGTAVLLDPNFPTTGPPPSVPEAAAASGEITTSAATPWGPPPTTAPATSTTAPGTPTPVARCKCGNPLLPPYAFAPPETTAPTTTTTTTVTTPPATTRPQGTSPPGTTAPPTTTPASSVPPSTEPPGPDFPMEPGPDGPA